MYPLAPGVFLVFPLVPRSRFLLYAHPFIMCIFVARGGPSHKAYTRCRQLPTPQAQLGAEESVEVFRTNTPLEIKVEIDIGEAKVCLQ